MASRLREVPWKAGAGRRPALSSLRATQRLSESDASTILLPLCLCSCWFFPSGQRLQENHLLCSPFCGMYPFMGCPALRLELRRHRLIPCYYLALKCPQHGEMRAAVKRVPEVSYRCPLCHALCGWTLLGTGGTHKQLPFWDELDGLVSGRAAAWNMA